ncbi:MAG: KilA-N domain-containing protein [Xanthobacteraceae bacterium]
MKFELKVRGRLLRTNNNLVCLNDVWEAAGFTKNQRPHDWMRLRSTLALVEAILKKNTGKSRYWAKSEYRSVIYTKCGQGGGCFADPRLALSYAEYLNPKLALEVREVFLRARAGDATLADEILDRASAEANLWAARRAQSRVVRNGYTDTLRDHGVTGRGYSDCTEETYIRLFDGRACQLRAKLGLPAKSSVRDGLNLVALTQVMLAEALSTERIKEEQSRGNKECKEATGQVASHIRKAVDAERADRQPRLGLRE